MIPRKHHFWSFLAITIGVCQIQVILTFIPLQNQHVGMGICAKHTYLILYWRYCSKTIRICRFWLKNCSVWHEMILILIPLQIEHDGWGYAQNTNLLLRAEIIPRKHLYWSFLAITIAMWQIQMILTLIPLLQTQNVGMVICAKHTY